MAGSPWRIIVGTLLVALNIWIWSLTVVLLGIRWNSIERPAPPAHEAFPYGAIRIGVDASFPPFGVATATDLFGLDIDLGKALAEEIGFPVHFVNIGFDGLYDAIRTDQVDMIISALNIDPIRLGDVRYSQSYFNAGLVLVSNPDQLISNIEDLPGHKLAYEFGSNADAEARIWARRVADFESQPYELPEYALDALRLGMADAALVDATSYRLYLRDYPDWRTHFTYVTNAPYAIAIRIDKTQTWESVHHALRKLIEDGTLDEILKQWL